VNQFTKIIAAKEAHVFFGVTKQFSFRNSHTITENLDMRKKMMSCDYIKKRIYLGLSKRYEEKKY